MIDFCKYNKFPVFTHGKILFTTATSEMARLTITDFQTQFAKQPVIAWCTASPPGAPWKCPLAVEIADAQKGEFEMILRAYRQGVAPDRESYGMYRGRCCSDYNFGTICGGLGILPVVSMEGHFRNIRFLRKLLNEKEQKHFDDLMRLYALIFPPLEIGEQVNMDIKPF